ncbi:MAG: hypothetical protein IJU11_06655 [Prevotella sp.]|nr:hypothetical protein [Prevotella sp.]
MARTNLEALRAKCKLICNTCYVDDDVLIDVLCDAGITPDGDASGTTAAVTLAELAVMVVAGWVETSRSEGGMSVGVSRGAVVSSIAAWCERWGLDASKYLSDSMTVVQDGSGMY